MEKNRKLKRIGVLFSGGLDSTYLVWKNLEEGNVVVPIYIDIKNNRDKVKLEKNRAELLVNKFRDKYTSDKIDHVRYPLTIEVSGNNVADLAQVPVWIMGLTYSQGYDLDEIQIAYVMNDDAISYLSEIKKLYKSYELITKYNKPRLTPLKFPLAQTNKYQMLAELPQEYKYLIVSCEEPRIKHDPNNGDEIMDWKKLKPIEYEACGHCEACKKLMSVYSEHDIHEPYDKVIKSRAINQLTKIKDVNYENDDNAHLLKIYVPVNDQPENRMEPKQLSFDFDNVDVKSKDIIVRG